MSCSCAGDLANIYNAIGNLEAQFNYITGNTLSNYNQLSRIVSQQSNIYNTVYFGLGNLSTGNLTVNNNNENNGNVRLNNGNLILTTGNILSTIGNLVINNGNIISTVGNLVINNGNIISTRGNLIMTNGNILSTTGNIILSNGNIGIGTSNPQFTLDITGNSRVTGNIFARNNLGVNTTSTGANLDVQGNARITGNLNIDNGTLWVDATNNRVGVLNTNPLKTFDVKGDGNISGDLYTTGLSLFSSQSPFKIDYGTTTVAAVSATITFNTTFSSPPTVIATGFRNSSIPSIVYIRTEQTTTTVGLYSKDDNGADVTAIFNWIAIGI
jgi:hypothetical protein